MLELIVFILALIPAAAIVYPFVRKRSESNLLESSLLPDSELNTRWEESIAGIRNTDHEWSIGNLDEPDYRWLREQYTKEAVAVLREVDREEYAEQEFLKSIRVDEDTLDTDIPLIDRDDE